MGKIAQIRQWTDWAWNHDAAEHEILGKLDVLLNRIDHLRQPLGEILNETGVCPLCKSAEHLPECILLEALEAL